MVLHPPVPAEDQPWTPKVDRPGIESPVFKQKTWKITSRWMQMNVQRPSHKRGRSLRIEECSLAIGNTTILKRTTSIRKTRIAVDEYLGLDESMDITTVNEQGVQWDFTNEELRNQAYKKIVAEKPFVLVGAHPFASWRLKSNASWSRMTQRER